MEEVSGQHLPWGTKLGDRYRIERVLGEGGFGVTYLAHDDLLTVDVVIKEYLPQEFSVREAGSRSVRPFTHQVQTYGEGLEKFLEEARAVARLSHPNIVRVSNFLEENGTAYFVMDYEEGEALDRQLARSGGKLVVSEVLPLLESLLGALEAVHVSGLLHRDIKPANIFMRKDRGPLLIDFGAARSVLGAHSRSISAIISPGYAPPEQYASASGQGPWTDLYALGATLHHCLVGVAPAESNERSRLVVDGDADPLKPLIGSAVGREAPRLALAVDVMLILSAKKRPRSVTEVRRYLAAVSRSGPTKSRVDRTRVVSEADRFASYESVIETEKTRLVRDEDRFPRTTPQRPFESMPKVHDASVEREAKERNDDQEKPAVSGNRVPRPKSSSPAKPRKEKSETISTETPKGWLRRLFPKRKKLTFDMVMVEGGWFEMGSVASAEGDRHNERRHRVRVEGFRIGKHVVTEGLWKAVMGSNPSKYKRGEDHPVENVSWEQVQGFIAKLNQMTEGGYRLPTEAEWEYACRSGGRDEVYSGGNDVDQVAWYQGNSGREKKPVGGKQPNRLGLYDMSGNVWEWTCSVYDENYGGAETRCASEQDMRPRVNRGGSFFTRPTNVRAAARYWYDPSYRTGALGFRLAQNS